MILAAVEKNDLNLVKKAIENGEDPSMNYNNPIRLASESGYSKIVEELLKDTRVSPTVTDNYPIKIAALYGHKEVIKVLVKDPRVDTDNIINNISTLNTHLRKIKDLIIEAKAELRDELIDDII